MLNSRFQAAVNTLYFSRGGGFLSAESNKKLVYARVQLDRYAIQVKKAQTVRERLLALSYRDGCIYQLMAGYRSILREVAELYQVDVSSARSALEKNLLGEYVQLCDRQGITSPELNYIQGLCDEPSSWLNKLFYYYSAALNGDFEAEVLMAPDKQAGLINTVQIGRQDSNTVHIDLLGGLISELDALLLELRQWMQES
ncbi:MAG: hypothetical protein KUG80_07575 [Gammaproteobacteria bacterium]|nr:hypothetical protein [Gammaproteobacteria bacterium]